MWPKAIVQEGQLVNLTCLVWTTNLTQPTYTWYRDGQQRPGALSILLPNVTVMDAASYRCGVVRPGQAPHLSRPVTLDVLCEFGWMQDRAKRNDSSPRGSRAWPEPHRCPTQELSPIHVMKLRTGSTELGVRRERFSLGRGAEPSIGQLGALGMGSQGPPALNPANWPPDCGL